MCVGAVLISTWDGELTEVAFGVELNLEAAKLK
jgi:hypothetical protein